MTRGMPFWLRLFGAFLAVIIVAVGGVAVLANRSASSAFASYVNRGRVFRAQALASTFEAHYQEAGSWQGAEALARQVAAQAGWPSGHGPGHGRAVRPGNPGAPSGRVVIADPDGTIVVDSGDTLVGKRLSEDNLGYGAQLFSGDQLRGYLLVGEFSTAADSLEGQFLHHLNRALLVAAGLAGGAALLLALLLARGLSGPLRTLAGAAGQLATGKRDLRVPLHGSGEVRLLAESFNHMAASLEQQEALRRQLIADIAHELRTPLAVIRGNLEALLDGIYRPTPETIMPIHEETMLLSRLVDELRDLALAEAGQLPLHLECVDPVELVRGVLSGFQAQAKERSIELPLMLPATALPPVEVDAGRIRQVLGNLLANALRYAPQRGRVRVALQQISPHWLQVRVSDNGPGISPGDLAHVFDRFYRGDRARARAGSSAGLGLAIARQWVEAHGGSIRAESAPGQGTTFTFTLPIGKAS